MLDEYAHNSRIKFPFSLLKSTRHQNKLDLEVTKNFLRTLNKLAAAGNLLIAG